jgi:hypothetical protein
LPGHRFSWIGGIRRERSSASQRTKAALNAFAITFADRFQAAVAKT